MVQNWHRVAAQERDILREFFAVYGTVQGLSGEQVRFTYPHSKLLDPDRQYPWRQVWQIVKEKMTGLKILNVRFVDLGHEMMRMTTNIKADWVLPILEVLGVEKI